MNIQEPLLTGLMERIARALERLAPPRAAKPDFAAAQAFIWQPEAGRFKPVTDVNRVPLPLLKGIDRMRDTLLGNTERSPRGCPPTTRCCGVRAAWAKARWSEPCMAR
jgi:hypothetical protein